MTVAVFRVGVPGICRRSRGSGSPGIFMVEVESRICPRAQASRDLSPRKRENDLEGGRDSSRRHRLSPRKRGNDGLKKARSARPPEQSPLPDTCGRPISFPVLAEVRGCRTITGTTSRRRPPGPVSDACEPSIRCYYPPAVRADTGDRCGTPRRGSGGRCWQQRPTPAAAAAAPSRSGAWRRPEANHATGGTPPPRRGRSGWPNDSRSPNSTTTS